MYLSADKPNAKYILDFLGPPPGVRYGAPRGAGVFSRYSHKFFGPFCDRVRATKHAPRDPSRVLERRHGFADIVECGAGVVVERLRVVALCIAPCVTPALFPEDSAEDDPKKYDEDPEEAKERDSVSSEEGAAPAGDAPAWHGSSVEVDDLWPSGATAREVPPRSLEL